MDAQGVEIWLVRHGETTMNEEGRLSGWSDVALTDCGRRQARWLKELLSKENFDGVWSSDLSRAVETARLAYGEPAVDARLREIDFGDLEGLAYETLAEQHKRGLISFEGFAPPGGETLELLVARVNAFLDELDSGRHVVFCHGGVLRAVMRQVGPDRFLPNGSAIVVDWIGQRLLAVHENDLGTSSAVVSESERKAGCDD
jgi:probable phosphoglycerate mutase